MMRTKAAILTMALSTSFACKPEDAEVDGVRRALPKSESIQIKVPQGSGGSAQQTTPDGIGVQGQELLGATADFYMFTRGVSQDLNGGAAFVLVLVHAIVQYPVTSVEGDTYIWGPWTETLNPSEWRLTVSQDLAGDYHWSLEGRRKADGAGAPYRAVVSGIATEGETEGRGRGTFTMDFDTAEQLDPGGNDAEGVLDVAYDLTAHPGTVEMDYAHASGAMFHYAYAENIDGSGDFQFTIDADLDENGSAMEKMEIRSRWLATGHGRSDFRVSGGDLPVAEATGSECWDGAFGRTYYSDSVNFQPTEGSAGECPFSDVQLPE
jgi:hypothetical protein